MELDDYVYETMIQNIKRRLSGAELNHKGQIIDEYWKEKRTSLLYEYYWNHCDRILTQELLTPGMNYDPTDAKKKKDPIDSIGLCLLQKDYEEIEIQRGKFRNSGSFDVPRF